MIFNYKIMIFSQILILKCLIHVFECINKFSSFKYPQYISIMQVLQLSNTFPKISQNFLMNFIKNK